MGRRQKQSQSQSWVKTLIGNVLWLAVAVGIGFLLQKFVISGFVISGGSMDPTLANGDYMYISRLNPLNRFDVVVVKSPDLSVDAGGNRKLFIKRIIGMPGDTLSYQNNQLYINGQLTEEPYLSEILASGQQLKTYTLKSLLDELRREYSQLPKENTTYLQKDGDIVIPEGYYFMLGDNRNISKDSDEFGLVHRSLVEGVAFIRVWPLNKIGIAPFQ